MKLLVAEDLDSVREHLGALLAGDAGIQIRFLPQDTAPLLLEAAAFQPDVVILDIRMRGGLALGALEAVKKRWPGMGVVLSASLFHPYYRTAFLSLGADLFFDKSTEWPALVAFLRAREAALLAPASPAAPARDAPPPFEFPARQTS